LSSGLPWSSVPDDGVEDSEQFAHRCDGGDDLGLAGGDQTVAEGLEVRVVSAGDEGCHE